MTLFTERSAAAWYVRAMSAQTHETMESSRNPSRDEPAPAGPNAIGRVGEFLIALGLALLAFYLSR